MSRDRVHNSNVFETTKRFGTIRQASYPAHHGTARRLQGFPRGGGDGAKYVRQEKALSSAA